MAQITATTSSQICTTTQKPILYFVLDTSGSMAGSKLDQVIHSVKEIIRNVPDDTVINVRVFTQMVTCLVERKKEELRLERLESDIRKSAGGSTALYDAWGTALSQIPYGKKKPTSVHLIVFTDGQDNSSKEWKLESVLDLMQKTMKEGWKFSFIQAGGKSPATDAVRSLNDPSRFMVYDVGESVSNIQEAFCKVSKVVQQQFVLQIQVKPDGSNSNVFTEITAGAVNVKVACVTGNEGSNAGPSFVGFGLPSTGQGQGLDTTPEMRAIADDETEKNPKDPHCSTRPRTQRRGRGRGR